MPGSQSPISPSGEVARGARRKGAHQGKPQQRLRAPARNLPTPFHRVAVPLPRGGGSEAFNIDCILDYHPPMPPTIIALAKDAEHRFSKQPCETLTLLTGLGVQGDAHAGRLVQHLSRMAKDPAAANLRQVHLIHAELFDELAAKGFAVAPGDLGENITTRGLDLLGLSRGTRLRLGESAVIEITGLRNPCKQIDGLAKGLMAATLDKASDGSLVRKCGVMATVVTGGEVRVGDEIVLESVPLGFEALGVV